MTISDSLIAENRAVGIHFAAGGGFMNDVASNLTVRDSVFSINEAWVTDAAIPSGLPAGAGAGAIVNAGGSTARVSSTQFSEQSRPSVLMERTPQGKEKSEVMEPLPTERDSGTRARACLDLRRKAQLTSLIVLSWAIMPSPVMAALVDRTRTAATAVRGLALCSTRMVL